MRLYENMWSSTYEEIKHFYPVWYWDVREMDAIWRVQGAAFDSIRRSLEQLVNNSFIATADSATIAQYEQFLGVETDSSLPLEERRKVILAILFPTPHIGAPEIRDLIRIYTDGTIQIALCGGTIEITIERNDNSFLNALSFIDVLRQRIPAHLGLLLHDDLCHDPVSTNLFIGAAQTMQCSRTTLPIIEPDRAFSTTLDIGGALTNIYSRQQLEECV